MKKSKSERKQQGQEDLEKKGCLYGQVSSGKINDKGEEKNKILPL